MNWLNHRPLEVASRVVFLASIIVLLLDVLYWRAG